MRKYFGRALVFLVCGLLKAAEVDSGMDAASLAAVLAKDPTILGQGWVRLRGIADPGEASGTKEGEEADSKAAVRQKIAQTRESLEKLRAQGLRVCVLLRLPGEDWKVTYLPKDLREVYERSKRLGMVYGDLVDAWEVDNEPDLGFVPEAAENYAAYLKAAYLGFKAGNGERRAMSQSQAMPGAYRLSPVAAPTPLVLMGALGLPPGPWFERFAGNDGLSYTDGFNYHYYGYAEDFTGVYRQFENAVKELGAQSTRGYDQNALGVGRVPSLVEAGENQTGEGTRPTAAKRELSALNSQPSTAVTKSLPIFTTEIGYGMLGKGTQDTKEGRLRQWRWFKSVGEQVDKLRIEAPLAFYLQPYLEYGTLEFGMTMLARSTSSQRSAVSDQRKGMPLSFSVGGLDFVSYDFGATRSEPWMNLIGKKIGGNEITPALAWWLGGRRGKLSGNEHLLSEEGTTNQKPAAGARSQNASGAGRVPSLVEAGENLTGEGPRPSVASQTSEGTRPTVLAARGEQSTGNSQPWTVTASAPSPVVIDFLAGAGLLPLKRYGGSFVQGRSASEVTQGGTEPGGLSAAAHRPPPASSSVRTEELAVHIRAQNGNLYEVYPRRMATADWQPYLEQKENFSMSFYGRAELPWRFSENKPASLSIVMYPKQLPAVYEFRRVQLLKLGEVSRKEEPKAANGGAKDPSLSTLLPDDGQDKYRAGNSQQRHSSQLSAVDRYGSGRIILYNFSEKTVSGRLVLPSGVALLPAPMWDECPHSSNPAPQSLKTDEWGHSSHSQDILPTPSGNPQPIATPEAIQLAPMERRVVQVLVKVSGAGFVRTKATIRFEPNEAKIAPARFETEFFPAMEGLKVEVAGQLTTGQTQGAGANGSTAPSVAGLHPPASINHDLLAHRRRATEEAVMTEQNGWFTQQGARVQKTPDGFIVTVTGRPPGKEQRVEVEIPWPERMDFPPESFLSFEYRRVEGASP